jgi:hypothetical protein
MTSLSLSEGQHGKKKKKDVNDFAVLASHAAWFEHSRLFDCFVTEMS